MKKFKTVLIGALLCMLFSSCTSVGNLEKYEDYDESMGTPENSVIFYGCVFGDEETVFSQMNTKLDPESQVFKRPADIQGNNIIVSKPVKPGSVYALAYSYGHTNGSYIEHYWNVSYPFNLKTLYINIPKEPGFYYIGWIDGLETVKRGYLVKVEETSIGVPSEKNQKKMFLNNVKQCYEGTVWEAAVDAEIERLK